MVQRVSGQAEMGGCIDHLLGRIDDALQSALVLGSNCSEPDGDGGGEDGLNNGSVELHHYSLWQLLQEVHPLLGFGDEGADVQLPLEVQRDDGAEELNALHYFTC